MNTIGYCAVILPIASIIKKVQLLIARVVYVDDNVKFRKVEAYALREKSCIEGVTIINGQLSTLILNLA